MSGTRVLVSPAPVQLSFAGFVTEPENEVAASPEPCCDHRVPAALVPRGWPADSPDTPAPTETRTALFRYFCRTVEMRMRCWRDRLVLELRADHQERVRPRFELEVRLQPSLAVRVRSKAGWVSRPWGLTAGLPDVPLDPFRAARSWVFCALVPHHPYGAKGKRNAKLGGLHATMRAARAAIRKIAVTAAGLLVAEARTVALRFANHMRPWLYTGLAKDRSGRLAQLAAVCPGALTFAYALANLGRRAGTRAAGGKLLKDVVAGRGLNEALDDAVAAWALGGSRLAKDPRLKDGERLIWRRVADASADDRRALLGAQRLLIRRAGAGVPSRTLWLPPPVRFAPEDIPTSKLANARWFRLVKGHHVALGPGRRSHDVASFLSRHAAAIAAHWKERFWPYSRIQEMLDYADATGDFPCRSTSPERYLTGVDRWHTRLARMAEVAEAAQALGQQLVDADGTSLALPPPPCPGWDSGGDRIVPLRTVEEVLAEGNRMQNCVVSRLAKVLHGRSALYHGEVGGKGLTIEIESSLGTYRLVEAKGVANAELSPAQNRLVGAFMRHFGEGGKCGCTQP